jgi:hypothetical protein
MALHLGLIPSWQFSMDPAVNPRINPHLVFPVGMNQLTVQPINNVVPSGEAQLGTPIATFLQPAVGVPKQLGNIFTTWWWNNRKWLAVGVASLLGVGAAVVAGKVLK